MVCAKPIKIYKNLNPAEYPQGLSVPCGKCILCRIKKRSEWSMRMLHELSYHKENVFITLTYDDLHLPYNENSIYPTLRKKHMQLFLKRLRKEIYPKKIKYFLCGEYGEETERPHYHAIIFGLGLSPEDKITIMKCWQKCDWKNYKILLGSFGIAEPDSIRYVAQYIDKKFSGDLGKTEYQGKDREPVFRLLSQGIGKQYILDNQQQVRDLKYISVNGVRHSLPRYYLKKVDLESTSLKEFAYYSECQNIEKLTGVHCTQQEFNSVYWQTDNKKCLELTDKIKKQNKQREKTQTKKSQLKQRELNQ